MHGTIFAELKKYVDTKLGKDAWTNLLKEAGLKGKVYMPIQEYPDEEVVKLVVAANKITKLPIPAILEDFGEFIAPDLVGMYKTLVDPKWKSLDLLLNTEQTIHKVVRIKNPGAKPPELRVSRQGPNEVLITYASARKMCGVAKGIAKGLGKYFGETLSVTEASCMSAGAPGCRISVKLVS